MRAVILSAMLCAVAFAFQPVTADAQLIQIGPSSPGYGYPPPGPQYAPPPPTSPGGLSVQVGPGIGVQQQAQCDQWYWDYTYQRYVCARWR